MMGKVKKVTSNHLFLPLFALALLLVFNAFATPGFFALSLIHISEPTRRS